MRNQEPPQNHIEQWQSFHFDEVSSTMDAVLKLASSPVGARFPFYVTCDHQTKGRGRFNRHWQTLNGNLFVTYALSITDPLALAAYPYLCALALFDSVQSHAHKDIEAGLTLKWPNDLLSDGKKCGGILLEAHQSKSSRPDSLSANQNHHNILLIGIGVNLVSHPDGTPFVSTNLSAITDVSPARLAMTIANSISYYQGVLKTHGFPKIRDQWLLHRDPQHSSMSIQTKRSSTPIQGKFHTINDQGQLEIKVRDTDGSESIKTINSGDTFFI